MIDHINFPVSNLEISLSFYQSLLATVDCDFIGQDQDAFGFGQTHWEFGIYPEGKPFSAMHIAFTASDKEQVKLFYATALQHGGRPNGTPGLRPEYGSNYYAAYILDPDNHNIEAVCRNATL